MFIDLIENLLLTVAFGACAFAAATGLAVRVFFAGIFPARVTALGQAPLMAPDGISAAANRLFPDSSPARLGSLACNGLSARKRRQAAGTGQF